MAETLNLIFSKSFEEVIWRIEISESGRLIILELRDEQKKKVKYSLVDLELMTCQFVELPGVTWLTSIFSISDEEVIFQQYKSTDNPEVEYYTSLTFSSSVITNFNSKPEIGNLNTIVKSPSFYPGTSEYFKTFELFVYGSIGKEIIKTGVEYLEWNSDIIISFYCQEEGLANYLLVVNQNKNKRLVECLGTDLKGIGRDTFCVVNNKLIFVKNKKELNIYR